MGTFDKNGFDSLAPSGNAQIPPSQFPVDHSMSNPSLPFSRQLYKLLCDRFHLPKATLGMLAYHTTTSSAPHFQVHSLASEGTVEGTKQSNNTADKISVYAFSSFHSSRKLIKAFLGITMKCRGSDLVGMKASVSVSHCRTTNITNALLFSHSPKQTAYIGDAVAGIAQLATHPAVIPTLLCNFHLDLLSRKLETTWNTLFDVEASSGQSGILLVTSTGLMPTGNCNDPNLSKKAIGAAQLAIAWETYAQSDFEFIAFINEFVASYDADPGTIQAQQTQVLKEYLSLVSQRGTMLLHGARHLRARAEVQASTVCCQ